MTFASTHCYKKSSPAHSVPCLKTTPSPQVELKRQVQVLVREETSKTLKVKCGWYTEKAMKETLKMAKFDSQVILIKMFFGFQGCMTHDPIGN